jgi:hypothetical protein
LHWKSLEKTEKVQQHATKPNKQHTNNVAAAVRTPRRR